MPVGMFTRPSITHQGPVFSTEELYAMLQNTTDENILLISSLLRPLKYVLKQRGKALYPLEDLMVLCVNTFVIKIERPLTHNYIWGKSTSKVT